MNKVIEIAHLYKAFGDRVVLKDANLDVYEGENIPVGCVSLTLRCVFLDREKTLTVDRVQGFSDNVVAFLSNRYAAELR